VSDSARSVAARAKESAEENFRIINDHYEYGQVDTLVLLTAQSNLTAAHNAYYDIYTAAAAIVRISGGVNIRGQLRVLQAKRAKEAVSPVVNCN